MKNVMAIDIGSSNTSIYKVGEGIVLFEPSAVVCDSAKPDKIKAAGEEAKKRDGKTIGSGVIYPIREGAVGNEALAKEMVSTFLNKVTLSKFGLRPKVVLSVPCGVVSEEIRKFEKVLNGAGVYDVSFVESPILTAIGLGLPISESTPCFIIDVGGGTTNIAAVSLDGVIAGISVSMGGKSVDAMIIDQIRDSYDLQIGRLTAENLKIEIGSLNDNEYNCLEVNGRDIHTGQPRTVAIGSDDIRLPIKVFFDKIFEITGKLMAKLPEEVSAEIRRSGVFFAGGGSLFSGLKYYASEKLCIKTTCLENSENANIRGGGIVAADKRLLKKVSLARK